MGSELERADHLVDSIELLVALLNNHFEHFEGTTGAVLNGRKGSLVLSETIRLQYIQVRDAAAALSIFSPPTEFECDAEDQQSKTSASAQRSPGDSLFEILHKMMTLLLEVEREFNQLHIEALAVPRLFGPYTVDEDLQNLNQYGGYTLLLRSWHAELSSLDQILGYPSEQEDICSLEWVDASPASSENGDSRERELEIVRPHQMKLWTP
jgi:hypothetical protein